MLEATGEEDEECDQVYVDEQIDHLLDRISTIESQDLIIEKALRDCREVFAYVRLETQEEEDKPQVDKER